MDTLVAGEDMTQGGTINLWHNLIPFNPLTAINPYRRSDTPPNTELGIVIECKRYTWTKTGNVPSAKMGFTNEAAFYLRLLPDNYVKYIVMLKANHSKRQESFAEYYYRINNHLLGKIKIAEYDPGEEPGAGELRIIGSET